MILCFSGTGNSLYVAKELARLCDEEVFSINEGLKNARVLELKDSDRLIFVVPTYAWRIPKVVDEWISKMDFGKNRKAWFVMTCGGEIGDADKYNKVLSAKKNFKHMGSVGIKLPDNYIIMFKDTPQEEAEMLLSKAKEKIPDIADKINSKLPFDLPRRNLYDRLMSSFVNPKFYKNVKADLFTASEKCIGCGACEKVCALNNISLENGKPKWGKNCTHCMACISYCKAEAIEYGSKTVGKRKYSFEGYFEN